MGGELDGPFIKRPWTPQDSAELYNIGGWGLPYFTINDAGHLAVSPHGELSAAQGRAWLPMLHKTSFTSCPRDFKAQLSDKPGMHSLPW